MDANLIFARWEDVVFEHRNKSYGAYVLRRAYPRRLTIGVIITLCVLALMLSLQRIHPGEVARHVVPPLAGADTRILPPPSIIPSHPPRGAVHREHAPATSRRIVVTKDVVSERETDIVPESVADDAGDFGEVGVPDGEGVSPVVEAPAVVAEPIRDYAEIMPSYEGGLEAMMKFIQKKIRYPRSARQQRIEGTVYVRFVVNGDGSVTDVQVMRGFHPDCDDEARRVVSMLPNWKGGSHNGRPVAVRMVLPIKFRLN